MRWRRAVSSSLAFGLVLWSATAAHAQETITNVSQLAQQFGKRDLLCLPVLPWLCHA
jgi:SpoU rRNA methylase family enzyme